LNVKDNWMIVVEVHLEGPAASDGSNGDIAQLVSYWRRNGQVLGDDCTIAVGETSYTIFATIPEAGALDPKYDLHFATEARQKLATAGFGPLRIRVRGIQIFDENLCDCEEHTHFILFTTLIQTTSCFRCGDCLGSIPLYRIPYRDGTKIAHCDPETIANWETSYKYCDSMDINSSVGEAFGMRQKQQLDSGLSKQGIAVCRELSTATGVPTYYYLHRYLKRARKKIERERRCPSCAGDWLLPEPHHWFDFKCDTCRLLSNMAP
jgi:predicted  nucleic acid-binding Zn ribbon protein